MKESDAAELIQAGLADKSTASTWVDLGSGTGTFTKALANLLRNGSKIIAIDKEDQQIQSPNPEISIEFIKHDFRKKLPELPPLDGILMANALHYVEDQTAFIKQLKQHLKADGRMIFVEYDTDQSNTWVPYPVTFTKLKELLSQTGYTSVIKIGEMDSVYNQNTMYACAALQLPSS